MGQGSATWGRGTKQHDGEGAPKSPGPGYFYLMCLSEKGLKLDQKSYILALNLTVEFT